MVTFTQKANSNGYSVNRMAFPYNPIMDNVRVYMQVAWADTKTGGLMLSRQTLIQMQTQPPGKMGVVYQPGTAQAVLNMSMQRIPLTRYLCQ